MVISTTPAGAGPTKSATSGGEMGWAWRGIPGPTSTCCKAMGGGGEGESLGISKYGGAVVVPAAVYCLYVLNSRGAGLAATLLWQYRQRVS